ncbi:MAG: OmpA family protein [Polyangiaceae bacterium]
MSAPVRTTGFTTYQPKTTPVQTAPKSTRNLTISNEIATACGIEFNDVSTAPKFDFDQSVLQPTDEEVLAQVARCVTTGPLKGRSLELVGRADPRGEVEYNFALGEHRADSVMSYLTQMGVDPQKVGESSRGKLDATGTDEAGWAKDRRVDITLKP